jgi:N-acyl-D-aspartate/D-glutamate deacylase
VDSSDRDVRASDAEREAVVEQLQRALAQGRLTVSEFDERVQAAYAARTLGALADLIRDLPRSLW